MSQTTESVQRRRYSLSNIYFYLTEGCNLRCRHCWIAPKYQAEGNSYPSLDPDLFRSIIDQAKPLGLAGVKLTGGEPLLHPSITDILETVRTENLRLGIETNGVLCTPDIAKMAASCKSPHVSVSLDGADAQTHEWVRGVDGCFEAALEGIRNLADAGLKPQVIMTLMRCNKDQIVEVIKLAESSGAGSVKFNLLQPTARGESMHRSGENLTLKELIDIGSWVENKLSASTRLTLFYSHPLAFKPLGRMFAPGGCGCSVCGILGIIGVLADGSYAMCGIGYSIPELVFGHAATDRLEDVWNRSSVLEELRLKLPRGLEGVCCDCLFKGTCFGHCIAQNYYATKNLWSPFWYCEEAKKIGAFPEGRLC